MKNVLNHTSKSGVTLFSQASVDSEIVQVHVYASESAELQASVNSEPDGFDEAATDSANAESDEPGDSYT